MIGGAARFSTAILLPCVLLQWKGDFVMGLQSSEFKVFGEEETDLRMKDGHRPVSEYVDSPNNLLLAFRAFDQNVVLNPLLNRHLIGANASIIITEEKSAHEIGHNGSTAWHDWDPSRNCHYLSLLDGTHSWAAFTLCDPRDGAIEGVVVRNGTVVEVRSGGRRLRRDVDEHKVVVTVKRWKNVSRKKEYQRLNGHQVFTYSGKRLRPRLTLLTGPRLDRDQVKGGLRTLELGVFMDDEAYKMYAPLYDYQDEKIVNFLLGLINQIQAIFYQDSLKLILTVVHLQIFKILPVELNISSKQAYKALAAFCDYQQKINEKSDDHPNHWDMALLFTGRKVYLENNSGRNASLSMGLSILKSVCDERHSCVIVQLGSRSRVGKAPPLTSGWLSAYITAHEIGHALGMVHDGYGNDCPRNGFLMSASRGTHGETTWSTCSLDTLRRLNATCLDDSPFLAKPQWDHMKFKMVPGQIWDADEQCQLFLKDLHAKLDTFYQSEICTSVRCVTPHRSGHYFAGPALDGTSCGNRKWCRRGECVPVKSEETLVDHSGWSKWSIRPCTSGCLLHSKGIIWSSRQCKHPVHGNSRLCVGHATKFNLCDDSTICPRRQRALHYATSRCQVFANYIPRLTADGHQMPYNKRKGWQACAIYCRLDSGVWYTPRYDFNSSSLDPYFPDGTWCHYDGYHHYYCVQRECIPEIVNNHQSLL